MGFVTHAISERLGSRELTAAGTYNFTRIKNAKARALAEHPNIRLLDFGIWEAGLAADPRTVRVLAEEAGKPENRRYADNGIF